jgi:HSP20 family protein
MDIPGTDQSKVKATLEDRTLTISGIRDEEVEHKLPGKAISKERRLGEFERSITLPGPVKQDGMQVSYDKGVLTVTVPKDTTQPKSGGNLLPMQ